MVDDLSMEGDTAAAADISTIGTDTGSAGADLSNLFDGLQQRGGSLVSIANTFARAMTSAFSQSANSGRQFDSVLRSLALRLSSMAVSQALRPLTSGLFGGSNQMFGGLFGGDGGGGGGGGGGLTSFGEFAAAMGAIKPFAAGGVVGTPTYFPLSSGGLGLAGEAGPEAILPLTRGSDGRLGVASGGRAAPANITVQIMTPDAESFRRSEIYVTGQIARAVARGQRSL
jgi:phage-related minor tail protein